MATQDAFRIIKDTSARKNTRVGSIQSAVQAAAMKESHDYYVERLTEGYKQHLETMEQNYEEQLGELKSQLTATITKAKEDAVKDVTAKAAEDIRRIQTTLDNKDAALKRCEEDLRTAKISTWYAEEDNKALEISHRKQVAELRRSLEAKLDDAQRENTSGPYKWIEVKVIRKYKSKMGPQRLVVKRCSTKFIDLVEHLTISLYIFEHEGRTVSNLERTLHQVSTGEHVKIYIGGKVGTDCRFTQLGFKDGDTVTYSDKPVTYSVKPT